MLEDDDCMLPYRWCKVSPLTKSAKTFPANEALRNGIDRKWDGEDNVVWASMGDESICFEWKKPQKISGARLIFDSDLRVRSKRMRKLEATSERVQIPEIMVKGFRIETRLNGKWSVACEDGNNFLRLRKISFAPVNADAVRLVVTSTWGAEKGHVFAMDIL